MNIAGQMIPHHQERRRGAPATISAVCALCGRVRTLSDLTADYPLYEQVRAARPDVLAVPLVCVDRHGCQRAARARDRANSNGNDRKGASA